MKEDHETPEWIRIIIGLIVILTLIWGVSAITGVHVNADCGAYEC